MASVSNTLKADYKVLLSGYPFAEERLRAVNPHPEMPWFNLLDLRHLSETPC